MKVIKTSKRFEGLLEANLEHEISKTTGSMIYTGPKIPALEWHKVLSFFRWCQQTYKSECQARLYVNTRLGTWKAWAYPQKARTGMSAQELDTPEVAAQRAQFPDSEGWIYFGTVHHHCTASAFQSGTDRLGGSDGNGEHIQDGLHITVGKMESDEHELHCRFYLMPDPALHSTGSTEFNPDMSNFWDIGLASALLPPRLNNEIARWQMCQKIDVEFPQQWKDNVIEVKFAPQNFTYSPGSNSFTHAGPVGGLGSGNGVNSESAMSGARDDYRPDWRRAQDAFKEIVAKADQLGKTDAEIWLVMDAVETNPLLEAVCDAVLHHKIEVSDIIREAETFDAKETAARESGSFANDFTPWMGT